LATKEKLIVVRTSFLEFTHEDWKTMGAKRHNLGPMFADNPCNMPLADFRVVVDGKVNGPEQAYIIEKGARYFWSMWDMPEGMEPLTLVRMQSILMEGALQFVFNKM
jgi:hypothetical protein